MSNIDQTEVFASSELARHNQYADFSIGALLLKMGKITQVDAERILKLQLEKNIRFGEAAKSLGLITEGDIQRVLARQFDYPYLPQHDIDAFSSELIAAYDPFTQAVEVFRTIRSQLIFNWFSKGNKVLAFTGIQSGEGSSQVVANLGVVFSQLGLSTLIVDANLRAPNLHKLFQIRNNKGLSEILAGRAGNEVISKVEQFENLSVLTTGTIPPNPLELVSRSNFGVWVESVSSQFDIILIDTPSLYSGADAQAITGVTNGLVVTIKKNSTYVKDAKKISEQLVSNGLHIVGTVLTDIN